MIAEAGIYRGRIAPTPTGYLHAGHACTFKKAWERANDQNGTLIYRNEDLDSDRCKDEFHTAAMEDIKWLGIDWDEGPDIGGPYSPYTQSERKDYYFSIWRQLKLFGDIYPCDKSRKDINEATSAPHDDDDDSEPIFPVEWRAEKGSEKEYEEPAGMNWRFRVPDGRKISFIDKRVGEVTYTAGEDFGDFLVWRRDNVPSYELAVVADDIYMQVTEVVRGEDLLKSTARQLLLYKALASNPPDFYHCELICDEQGNRLAKRDDAMSIRTLREKGYKPEDFQ